MVYVCLILILCVPLMMLELMSLRLIQPRVAKASSSAGLMLYKALQPLPARYHSIYDQRSFNGYSHNVSQISI
jgi:hypothetical protein